MKGSNILIFITVEFYCEEISIWLAKRDKIVMQYQVLTVNKPNIITKRTQILVKSPSL
jgi:hypothetical protein